MNTTTDNTQTVSESEAADTGATAAAIAATTPAPSDTDSATTTADSAEKPKANAKKKVKAKGKTNKKANKDQFGLVKGKKNSQAAAMYARPNGATSAEVAKKLGGQHLNVIRWLENQGHTFNKTKVKGPKGREITRYTMTVNKDKLPKA